MTLDAKLASVIAGLRGSRGSAANHLLPDQFVEGRAVEGRAVMGDVVWFRAVQALPARPVRSPHCGTRHQRLVTASRGTGRTRSRVKIQTASTPSRQVSFLPASRLRAL